MPFLGIFHRAGLVYLDDTSHFPEIFMENFGAKTRMPLSQCESWPLPHCSCRDCEADLGANAWPWPGDVDDFPWFSGHGRSGKYYCSHLKNRKFNQQNVQFQQLELKPSEMKFIDSEDGSSAMLWGWNVWKLKFKHQIRRFKLWIWQLNMWIYAAIFVWSWPRVKGLWSWPIE